MTDQTPTAEDAERTENKELPTNQRVLQLDASNTAEAIADRLEFDERWFIGARGSVPGTHVWAHTAWNKKFDGDGTQLYVPVDALRIEVGPLCIDEDVDRTDDWILDFCAHELKGRNVTIPVLVTDGDPRRDEEVIFTIRIREDVDCGISEIER